MGRTVFLGDSHAAGYWVEPDQTVHQWEHNYGNSYSKEYNKDVVVYATPGACNKKYPIWRLDTLFSSFKQTNLKIVEDGGWHFTNLKTAEEIYTKLSNFGHHNEFDVSGVTAKDIQKCIDNKVVNYNHQADKSEGNKYNANYKLKLVGDEILPNYLANNKDKYKDWFDYS